MSTLSLGLLIFLAVHSIRMVADDWRRQQIAGLGETLWKGLFAAISLLGFGLIVWGYGQARALPLDLWNPPVWTRHLAALLTVPSFVMLVAAYVPGNRIKSRVGHPMLAGVALWAFAHLLANGRLADVLLFGAFLVWALADFSVSRRRDDAAGTRPVAGTLARDALVLAVGLVAWVAFVKFAHLWLIGVAPLG